MKSAYYVRIQSIKKIVVVVDEVLQGHPEDAYNCSQLFFGGLDVL